MSLGRHESRQAGSIHGLEVALFAGALIRTRQEMRCITDRCRCVGTFA